MKTYQKSSIIIITLLTSCASNVVVPVRTFNKRTVIEYESEPKKTKITNSNIQAVAVAVGNVAVARADGMSVEQEHCIKNIKYKTIQDIEYRHQTNGDTIGYLLGSTLIVSGIAFLIGAINASPQSNRYTGEREDPTAGLAITGLLTAGSGMITVVHTVSTKNKIKNKPNFITDYETFDTQIVPLPMSECDPNKTKQLNDQVQEKQEPTLTNQSTRTFAILKAEKYIIAKTDKDENSCTTYPKIDFHENGNTKSKNNFCKDSTIQTGIQYEYFEDGKTIKKIESYYNNKKDGYWFTFDIDGKIESAQLYQNDQQLSSEDYLKVSNISEQPTVEEVQQAESKEEVQQVKSSDRECFFDEETSKNVCCKQSKVLDKKTKKFTIKWVCDNNQTFNKESIQ